MVGYYVWSRKENANGSNHYRLITYHDQTPLNQTMAKLAVKGNEEGEKNQKRSSGLGITAHDTLGVIWMKRMERLPSAGQTLDHVLPFLMMFLFKFLKISMLLDKRAFASDPSPQPSLYQVCEVTSG